MTDAPLKIVPVYLRADQLRMLMDALRATRAEIDKERGEKPELNRGMVGRVLDEQMEINRMLEIVLEAKLKECERA